jgi:MoaA/NifB/PqqE/SkfB family radical SAM enzyme
MCGFGKDANPFNKNKFLSFYNYKTILQQIGDKTKTIRLNGRGESTIHPDFVEILNYTKQIFPQLNINLFSNFSFKNDKVTDALVENGVQLFISMDSPIASELTAIRKGANFQFIENNIKQISKLPNRPFIIFTIQEANIQRIFDMAKFACANNCQILYNTIHRDDGIETFIEAVKTIITQLLNNLRQSMNCTKIQICNVCIPTNLQVLN